MHSIVKMPLSYNAVNFVGLIRWMLLKIEADNFHIVLLYI